MLFLVDEQVTIRMEPSPEKQVKQTNMTVFKDRSTGYLLKVNPVRIPPPPPRTDFSKYNIPVSRLQQQMYRPPVPASVQQSNMSASVHLGVSQNVKPSNIVFSNQLPISQDLRETNSSEPPTYPGTWSAHCPTSGSSNIESSIKMAPVQNPNSVPSSSVQARTIYPYLAAEQFNGTRVDNLSTNSNVMVNNIISSGNTITPTTLVQGTDNLMPETTDYLLLDLDQTTNHSSQAELQVQQTPVTASAVSSEYQAPVTMVSSGYQAPVTMVSSVYHHPVTMGSSGYHPSGTVISTEYDPAVVSSGYQPPVTMVASEYDQQSSVISKGYQQIVSAGHQNQGHGLMTETAGHQQQLISGLPSQKPAGQSNGPPGTQLSLISTVNSRVMQSKVCQNSPVVQTVTKVQTNRQTIQFKETGISQTVLPQSTRIPNSEILGPYCACQAKDYTAEWMKAVSFKLQGHDSFMTNVSSVVINRKQVFTFRKNDNLYISVGELKFKNILPKGFRYLTKIDIHLLTLEDKEMEFLIQKKALITRKIKRCMSLEHLREILKNKDPWFELKLGHHCPKVDLLRETSVFVCPVCRHFEPPQDGDGINGNKCSKCFYLKRNHEMVVPSASYKSIEEDDIPIGYIEVEEKKICAFKYQGQTFVSCCHLSTYLSGFPLSNFVNLAQSLKVNFVSAPRSVLSWFLQHLPSEVIWETFWCTLAQLRCIACFSVGQMNNTEFLARNQILPLIAQGQYKEVFPEPQQPVRKSIVFVTRHTRMPPGHYTVDDAHKEHFIDIIRQDGTVYRLCREVKAVGAGEQNTPVKMNDILSIAAKEIMANAVEDSEIQQDGHQNTNVSHIPSDGENSAVNTDVQRVRESGEIVQTTNTPSSTPVHVASQIPQSTQQKWISEQSKNLSKEPELLSMPNGFFDSVPPIIPQVTKQKKHFLSPPKVGKPQIKAKETKSDVIVIENENGDIFECTPLGLVKEFEKNGYCFTATEKEQQVATSQEAGQQGVSRPTSTCPSLDSGISERMELTSPLPGSEEILPLEESQTALPTETHADIAQKPQEDVDTENQGRSPQNAVETEILVEQGQEILTISDNLPGENPGSCHPPREVVNNSLDNSFSFPEMSSPRSDDGAETDEGKEKTDNLSILASVAEEARPFSVETVVDESIEPVSSDESSEKVDGSMATAVDVISVSDSVIVESVNQLDQITEHAERNFDCSKEFITEELDPVCHQEHCSEYLETSAELTTNEAVRDSSCRDNHDIENLEELKSICVELDQPKVQAALPQEEELEGEEAGRNSIDIYDPHSPREKPDCAVHQEKLPDCEGARGGLLDHDLSLSSSDDELPVDRIDVKASPDVTNKSWMKVTMDLSENSSENESETKGMDETLGRAESKAEKSCSEHLTRSCEGTDTVETYLPNANLSSPQQEALIENFSMYSQKLFTPKSSNEDIPRRVNTEDDKQNKEGENFDQLSLKLQDMINRQSKNLAKSSGELTVSFVKDSMIDLESDNSKHERCENGESSTELTVQPIEKPSVSSDSDSSKQKLCESNIKSSTEVTVQPIEKPSVSSDSDSSKQKLCEYNNESSTELPSIKTSIIGSDIDHSKHERSQKKDGSKSKRKKKAKELMKKKSISSPAERSNIKLTIHKGRCVSITGQKSKTEPKQPMDAESDQPFSRDNTKESPRKNLVDIEHTSKKHHKSKKRKHSHSVFHRTKKQKVSKDLLEICSANTSEVGSNMSLPERKEYDFDKSKGEGIDLPCCSRNIDLSEIAITRDFTSNTNERTVITRDNGVQMTVNTDSENATDRSEISKLITHDGPNDLSSNEGLKEATNEKVGDLLKHQKIRTNDRTESSEFFKGTDEKPGDIGTMKHQEIGLESSEKDLEPVTQNSITVEGDTPAKWWSHLSPVNRMKGILNRVVIQGIRESGSHLDLQLQVDPSIYQIFGEDEERKRSLNEKLHQLSRIAVLQRKSHLISQTGNGCNQTLPHNDPMPSCSNVPATLNSAQGENRTPHCGSKLDKTDTFETDNSTSCSSVAQNTICKKRKRSKESSTKFKANDHSPSKKRSSNSGSSESSQSRKISVRPLHAGNSSATMDTTEKNDDFQTIKVTVLYD